MLCSFKVPLIRGIFMLGQGFGAIVLSPLADVIGRKPTLFAFVFAAGLANMVNGHRYIFLPMKLGVNVKQILMWHNNATL